MKRTSKMFWVFRWLLWFWWVKVRSTTDKACHPDCVLCEVNCRQGDHYDGCETCQGDGYPCATMEALNAEEQAAIGVVFPDLDGPRTASSIPVVVLPPWDWSKK